VDHVAFAMRKLLDASTCDADARNESSVSVTSDIGPVVSEVVLASMAILTMGGGLRIWREKPKPNTSGEDRRPQWMVVGALPTGICVMSLAIAFPLSYGLQDKTQVLADLCFYFGGFFFARSR
jgi:hypothetical protein